MLTEATLTAVFICSPIYIPASFRLFLHYSIVLAALRQVMNETESNVDR